MRAGTGMAALWAAVFCAGAAGWLLSEWDPALRRARLMLVGGQAPDTVQRWGPGMWRGLESCGRAVLAPLRERFGWRIGREALCLPIGLVLGLAAHSVLPALAGAAAVPLVGRRLRERARRGAADRRVSAVGALCGTVAGDLRAGRPPHTALAGALEDDGWPDAPELVDAARLLLAAARFGGDVPAALRAAARQEGAEGLAAVAACWQVAVDGGAGLAAGLDRIAAALRAERDQRDDLRAQLAGPRSTALMLALLPLFGVVLGVGLGADPVGTLLGTPTGLACLVAGGLLEWAGLAWTGRIVRAAEESG
ncbi:type II secretion system F family protein [Streptomyces sp. H10-C2]|uniref:type II secretion system F family protein n=1 Tax=unclassified Streptomyces TaxID=2593676 RepID=UPI0024B87C8A|nr:MULTISPECIES: type II secretion system F family protein [unclassified Streptomyces]MDJ0346178.1 type II secretion system F family protein [Streptomyces sp. PH10-H1]MDJ0374835.1 type II secretion system F family protein [Streptomyces sp. H10-C2]